MELAVREIVIYDDPRLRERSRRVKRVTPDLRVLVEDMVETMHSARGVGLAAVQVGVAERVIVIEIPEPEEEEKAHPGAGKLHALLNPEVARGSRELEEGIEGCLSIPGLVGQVTRHHKVTVKGMDITGRKVRIKAEGLLARVLQHEIDHCNGVLFIDRIEDPEKLWQVPEGEEEAAEAAQEVII
jgi:peptide deformylase